MKAIVAVDNKWGIGKDGGLLVHLSGDLKYFKENTIGGTIVIGRKTLESFPGARPLPGRTNIVLTRNGSYEAEGCVVCHSAEEVGEACERLGIDTDRVFVCGGGSVYRQMLPMCDEVLVTRIDGEFDADTFFPDLDADPDFEVTWSGEATEENGVIYRFTRYTRNGKQ